MNKRELKSVLESLLFVWGEPLNIKDIMKILETDKKTVLDIVKELQEEIEHYRRGIILNNFDGNLQLSTRAEHSEIISKLVKTSKRNLSNSSMEVLAIIAYNQPITRIEIDNIRGVKSYSSIDNLKAKGLIEEVGKLDGVGKPNLYGTTVEFLRAFNISSLDELPIIDGLEEFKNSLEEDDEN